MALDELFDDLWATPVGRAFVCNFVDGLRWKIIRLDDAKRLLAKWDTEHSSGGGIPALSFVDHVTSSLLLTLRSSVRPSDLPTSLATSLAAKYMVPVLRGSPTPGLLRIADLIEQFGHAVTEGERYAIQSELYLETEARAHSSKDGIVVFEMPMQIAGPSPYAWFTSYASGDLEASCWKSRSEWSLRADETRDTLGLIHRGSTKTPPYTYSPELVGTYVVPKGAVPIGTKYHRPSCLDAGANTRFKCLFGNLSKRPYEWGRALHLSKLHGHRPHRGGRELVIENFIPSGKIGFAILGQAMVKRRDFLSFHDDMYEMSVRRGRHKADLRERFLKAGI